MTNYDVALAKPLVYSGKVQNCWPNIVLQRRTARKNQRVVLHNTPGAFLRPRYWDNDEPPLYLFRVQPSWIIPLGSVSNYFLQYYVPCTRQICRVSVEAHILAVCLIILLGWSDFVHSNSWLFLGGSPDGLDPGFRERLDADSPSSPSKPVKLSPRKALRQRRYSDRFVLDTFCILIFCALLRTFSARLLNHSLRWYDILEQNCCER